MKIRTKLLWSYTVISLLSVLIAVSLYGIKQIKTDYRSIDESQQAIITLREIQFYLAAQANDEHGFLLTGSPEYRKEILDKAENIERRIKKLEYLLKLSKERALLNKIDEVYTQFTQINLRVIERYKIENLKEAQHLSFTDGQSIRRQLEANLNELVQLQEEAVVKKRLAADNNAGRIEGMVLIGAVVAVFLGMLCGADRKAIQESAILKKEAP